MPIERFEDLRVWRLSVKLALQVHEVSVKGAFRDDFVLRNQVRKAAVSTMSNIAEGFERYSRSEFRYFLSVARGSAAEVRAQMHLARLLDYVDAAEHSEITARCTELSRRLAALRSSIPLAR